MRPEGSDTVADDSFERNIIEFFGEIHPLDQVLRAGYVLRGIASPECVSAHSHFVSVLTLIIVERYPDMFDRAKSLAMAIVHDLPEAVLMDVPLPASERYLKEAKKKAEEGIYENLFRGFDGNLRHLYREYAECKTPEARLVNALDRAQMMLKIYWYQKEKRGRLDEFWLNGRNFRDFGIEPVSRLFDAICQAAGVERPRE
jgi:putative hydrolase of HD superfamily